MASASNCCRSLLRHGRIFTGGDHWTRAHRRWLAAQSFEHPAQQIVFEDALAAIEDTVERLRRLEVLVEAAWSYRHPARVSDTLRARLEALPKTVRDIAWKAQVRLCGRYRRLNATGKKLPVIIAAIAREMAAFLWAIARQVNPAAVT